MASTDAPCAGSAREVFQAFLKLGLTSFGGPIAHIGYFREELIVRRRWLAEADYADVVALCQFLPGPTSSQVGLALGLSRCGYSGALAAWCGFTLPSAMLMVAFAYGAAHFTGPLGIAAVHGLKIAAVAVVAHATLGMARTLTPDATRIAMAAGAAALALSGGPFGQLAAIALGLAVGALLLGADETATRGGGSFPLSRRVAKLCLILFASLLVMLPALRAATGSHAIALFDSVYRSGALVFGGGHVVLPLLKAEFVAPGWIANDAFLAGYGAAQALPGPLFAFAAYIGAAAAPAPNGVVGAAVALFGVFLPGVLILLGALPFWQALRSRPIARAALRGANATVVGVLAAALYDPLWTSAIFDPVDMLLAAVGFAALLWRAPPLAVVAGLAAAAIALPFV